MGSLLEVIGDSVKAFNLRMGICNATEGEHRTAYKLKLKPSLHMPSELLCADRRGNVIF